MIVKGSYGKDFDDRSFVEVGKGNIKDIVAEEKWQELRLSFIGTWTKDQDSNIIKLKAYLGENPNARKLRIVANYTSGSLFRMRPDLYPKVKEFHEEIMNKRKKGLELEG